MSSSKDLDAITASLRSNLGKSFATPMKFGGGHNENSDDDGSATPVFFGTDLARVSDSSNLCLGKVGNGEKVCLRMQRDCNTRAHRNTVDLVHQQCLLIRAGEGANAFTRPSLDTSKLKETFVRSLLNRSESDWAKVFGFLTENKITDATQETQMSELTTDVKAQIMPRTPARRKAKLTTEEAVNDLFLNTVGFRSFFLKKGPVFATYEKLAVKTSEGQDEDSDDVRSEYDELVATQLDNTSNAILKVSDFLQVLTKAHEGHISDLENSVAGLRGLVTLVEGALGERSESYTEAGPDLWSSMHGIFDKLNGLEETIETIALALRDLQEFRKELLNPRGKGSSISGGILRSRSVKRENDGWNGGFRDLGSGYHRSASAGYNNQMPGGSWGIPDLSGGVGGGGRGFGGGFGGGGAGGGSGGGSGGGRQPNSHVNFDVDEDYPDPDDIMMQEDDPVEVSRLDDLERRLARVELRQAGHAEENVYFGGHIFNSIQDLSGFLDRFLEGRSLPSGLFPSPHQLLNLIYLELAGSLPGMKDFKALKDLGVGNRDYYAAMAAFKPMPAPFEASSGITNHAYKSRSNSGARFKAIPSYTDWGHRSIEDALSFKFARELDRWEGKLQASIASEFRQDAVLQVLASGMLRESTRFVRNLFDYMTECYESLNPAFNNPAETWDLVCFSVEQLFMNEFTAARISMTEEDFTDTRKLALEVIWSNLKCMSVLESFNRSGISKHPSMNSSQVRFVLRQAKTNNSNGLEAKVTAQEKEIQELKELVAAQTAAIAAIKGKLQSVESRADKALEAAGAAPGKKGKGS